jgi:hypothetical protein
MRRMKDKYDQTIGLVYEITKQHTEDGAMNGDVFAILEDVLEYIQDKVAKNIYENYQRNLLKIKV